MRNIIVRYTAVVLCLSLVFSVFSVNVYADDFDEWSDSFDAYSSTAGNPLMSPGSNETERNFSWYSSFGSTGACVLVSENADMTDAGVYRGRSLLTPEGDRVNKVTVKNLVPGREYYYQCVTSDGESAPAKFTTVEGSDFSALYVTDLHVSFDDDEYAEPLKTESYNVHRLLSAATSKSDISLVISAGDQASNGLRTEYLSLVASPLWSGLEFALCAGNHDRKGFDYKYFNNNPNKYQGGTSSFIAKDYWYVKGDVLFMVFDSNCFSATTHRAFARDAVKANPGIKWKVAAFHHDMYGVMSEKRMEYSETTLRPIFGEICDEFGIDLCLTGHTHHYTVSNAVFGTDSTDMITGNDSITDPRGTIYMVSASLNHPRDEKSAAGDIFDENIGYSYLSDEPVYNILDFTEDSITVKSYTLEGEEPFNTLTVYKTDADGGHPSYTPAADKPLTYFALDFKAVFEEFGIMVKVIFNWIEIMQNQKYC